MGSGAARRLGEPALLTYTLALPTAVWAVQLPGLAVLVAVGSGGARMRAVRSSARAAMEGAASPAARGCADH